jgi:hypothetical protein
MMRVALCFRRVQAWYAAGFREGNLPERIAIFPCWFVFRVLFVATFAVAKRLDS